MRNFIIIYSWANLELQTFDVSSDKDQAYYAGLLEGYVTGDLISKSYYNWMHDFCTNIPEFCVALKAFLAENTIFIKSQIRKYGTTSDYWHQLSLVYKQLEGMQRGYNLWKKENHIILNENQNISEILLLHVSPETADLLMLLKPATPLRVRGCSALVKPLADGRDLYVGHTTWSPYSYMLRIMKKYKFAFRPVENREELIPGHSVAFSSYPGHIHSPDDYYILSSGLVVQETTLHNFNESLWANGIRANAIVLQFVRTIVANRLADSGKSWTDIFRLRNSGTYNNQYMIVDYKRYRRGTKLSQLENGLLWVLEQMPEIIIAEDKTDVLRQQGYWASYNIPYYEDIYKITGHNEMVQSYGPFFSYDDTARARIFRRDHLKVTDLKSMYKLMRYNDFKNDLLSQCSSYDHSCSPPFSADSAIAARNDLNDPNGDYPISEWDLNDFSSTDTKVTNLKMVRDLEMLAVSGPTNEQQPSFRWSTSPLKDLRHRGHPDLFNFCPIYTKWFPFNYINACDIKFV
jgi:hypothetical protein